MIKHHRPHEFSDISLDYSTGRATIGGYKPLSIEQISGDVEDPVA